MRRSYFPSRNGDPEALHKCVRRAVRFDEVDPLGIVWHGHYAKFFDDARVALGDAYGMGYLDYLDHGVMTPIRKIHVDHLHPLSYPETATVEAILHWSEAARIDYEFVVRCADGAVAATGYTVQMMLDAQRNILMAPPQFIVDIREQWRRGILQEREREPGVPLVQRVGPWQS